MKLKVFLLIAVVCLLASKNSVIGQSDFFWSTYDLNSGATNSDAYVNSGDNTGSLFLYYSTVNSELDTGAGLDLSWTNDGVVAFTAAVTLDFEIKLASCPGGVVLGDRWGDFSGSANELTPDSVTGLNAFRVIEGDGIVNANDGSGPFLDLGYDFGAESFLFARVDYEILDPLGYTELVTTAGSIGIVNDGQTVNPSFGRAVFGSVPVPEPTAVGFLIFAFAGLVTQRRRN